MKAKAAKGTLRHLKAATRWIFIVVAALWAVPTLVCAYGGMVDPARATWPGIAAMAFPAVGIVAVVLLIAELLLKNRAAAIVTGASLIVVMPVILNYSPVHLMRGVNDDERDRSFTVMTFNALWWRNYDETPCTISPNPSLQYVLDINPDILCTQENRGLVTNYGDGITADQIAEMERRYPYRELSRAYDGLTIYSKYPITRVVTEDVMSYSSGCFVYRVSIQGHLLTVINMHLESLGMTQHDRRLYEQLTEGKPNSSELNAVKTDVLSKVSTALTHRAEEARQVRELIDEIAGPLILCGDFNDVPSCYAVRTVKGDDLRDAYADGGLGPAITYHANKLYFRIDHILYRGPLRAVKAWRGKGLSDHYPLVATFVWDKEEMPQNESNNTTKP